MTQHFKGHERQRILSLHEQGLSAKLIAERLGYRGERSAVDRVRRTILRAFPEQKKAAMPLDASKPKDGDVMYLFSLLDSRVTIRKHVYHKNTSWSKLFPDDTDRGGCPFVNEWAVYSLDGHGQWHLDGRWEGPTLAGVLKQPPKKSGFFTTYAEAHAEAVKRCESAIRLYTGRLEREQAQLEHLKTHTTWEPPT